jgi:type II secretory pathway pseudopilin PulG
MKFDEKGQTLIEVLVAMATAVAVMSAIAVTVVTSLSNVEFTKNQNLATQYSREGLEVVKRLARSNWPLFLNYNARNYCLAKGTTTLTTMGPNGCGQNVDIFRRQIDIEQNSSSCDSSARVTSIVSWFDSRCGSSNVFCHEVRLDSCVANINPIGGVTGP